MVCMCCWNWRLSCGGDLGKTTTKPTWQIIIAGLSVSGDAVYHPSASCIAFSNYLMLIHSNYYTKVWMSIMAGKPAPALSATCAPFSSPKPHQSITYFLALPGDTIGFCHCFREAIYVYYESRFLKRCPFIPLFKTGDPVEPMALPMLGSLERKSCINCINLFNSAPAPWFNQTPWVCSMECWSLLPRNKR